MVWLTEYLKTLKSTLIIVSHDRSLLDEVCDTIVWLDNGSKKLLYFNGNYTTFEKHKKQLQTKKEEEWQKLMKRCKSLRTKKEREELVLKSGLIEPSKPYKPVISFKTPTSFKMENPLVVNDVSFSYGDENVINNVSLSINMRTRITIVGNNGSGKSTFMKIIAGQLKPTSGEVLVDQRLKIAYFHQQSAEYLDGGLSPVECLINTNKHTSIEEARKVLGCIGLAGEFHNKLIETLSGGQKSRVSLACIIVSAPHIILLDEPTNHFDIETVQGLIKGINEFEGGVVMITHDEKLIVETNCDLWVCKDKTVYRYNAEYEDYKEEIINELL